MTTDNIEATEQPTSEWDKIIIDGVAVQHVPLAWAGAWPWLERAIRRFPQVRRKLNAPRILNDLAHSRAQLWGAWTLEGECFGAVLTEITKSKQHEDKLLMEIPLVGGKQWNDWGDDMWRLLKQWGRAQGCTHAVGYGRSGWMRLYGFERYGETEDGIPILYRALKEH